jgi:hypothetical protein
VWLGLRHLLLHWCFQLLLEAGCSIGLHAQQLLHVQHRLHRLHGL